MGQPSKQTRARGHLGRGALASLLLHLHLLVPLLVVVFIRAGREEANRPEEVDVAFENVEPEQLPENLPPLDETPPPATPDDVVAPALAPKDEKKAALEEKKKPTPPPEAQKEKEKKVAETPPPPVPPPPVAPPPPPAPPALPEKRDHHEKIVELDDDKKKVEPPPDAKYLAQRNSRTEEETRARHTNLEREQQGETSASAPPKPTAKPSDEKMPGEDKEKIAELEEQKSKEGRQAPSVDPHLQPQAESLSPPEPPRPEPKSPVLSLRESLPRSHEITPETVDPSLPHDPAGLLARPRPKSAFQDDAGGRLSRSQRVRLALSGKEYEMMFGAEAKADRQLAQKQRSSHLGSSVSRRLAQVRSALENFIPEVKAGTRTVVNARAAPFAAFIARAHRQIHKFWGFGVLEDWDGLPGTSPFNDDKLMTTLEIVLNDNGTVNKIAVVKASGYMAYDAAAIDAVLAAAPFPDPPREILSNNGKIYFHWNFARDGRACGTEGVRYFILDNAPPDRASKNG